MSDLGEEQRESVWEVEQRSWFKKVETPQESAVCGNTADRIRFTLSFTSIVNGFGIGTKDIIWDSGSQQR